MGCGASATAPTADESPKPVPVLPPAKPATPAVNGDAAQEPAAEERTLRQLFDSIDVDGDNQVTAKELRAKMQSDSTVQALLVAAGGSRDYVMEQLDLECVPH